LRREGVFTSVYVFIERLGYSLAPLMLGALLQAMGFNKNLPLEHQSHGAQLAVILSLVGIPVATFALSLVLLRWYDLTDEKLADTRPRASPGRMAE
jgi:Na+/melibiose symporter-like transporter